MSQKYFSVPLSDPAHRAVKIWAASNGVQVAPLLRDLLLRAATDPKFSDRLLRMNR